ncbi:hypothetical protein Cyrtocomes_01170 [Candidatus Cyrtobacter comes]|uniref:Pectate lyase superfamily protein domain-containing protein n=1 Tax=Candidatus Cyrtobacter comes TaxID=675776 RepID=A0ABU5LA48_9RICK|nr:hypothetical protein [Candidatus Cyrtobacter comes]MDZ5762775.1 hypothetical protein [Candidatus Cyrtobacter comes]
MSAVFYNENDIASKFSEVVKKSSECLPSSCPSGVYFSGNGDAQGLYALGSQIGGPQSTMRHGETSEWSSSRYAILVGEGNYNMPDQFKLGYYTQVMGVANDENGVHVAPGINVLNNCEKVGDANCKAPGGLDNFWRSLSDISMEIGRLGAPLRFAVSQAAPIRSVNIVGGDILMCDWGLGGDCGFTSGGFISNMHINSKLILGSQQQFYVTDSTFSQLQAGVWNIVSNNNQGTVFGDGDSSTKNIWKGYPFTQTTDDMHLVHPKLLFNGKWNVKLAQDIKNADDFVLLSSDVSPAIITAAQIQSINSALAGGAPGLIITPGIYELGGVLNIPDNKIVIGLGLPSLVCQSSSGGCMHVGSEGVHLTGITFDAGVNGSASDQENVLLIVGDLLHGNKANPTVLQDVYCRIARINDGQISPVAYACVRIDANCVVGENLWLWRADHDAQALQIPFSINYCKHGLIVNGDDVKMKGLFVEHFNDIQTVWLGKNGQIKFYQSELPYFMPTGGVKVDCTIPNSTEVIQETVCPSLYIAASASGFDARGIGVYCFFPNALGQGTIKANTVIKTNSQDASFAHVVVRWLNGDPASGINAILEDSQGRLFPEGSSVDGNNNKGYAFDTFPLHLELDDICIDVECAV